MEGGVQCTLDELLGGGKNQYDKSLGQSTELLGSNRMANQDEGTRSSGGHRSDEQDQQRSRSYPKSLHYHSFGSADRSAVVREEACVCVYFWVYEDAIRETLVKHVQSRMMILSLLVDVGDLLQDYEIQGILSTLHHLGVVHIVVLLSKDRLCGL